MEGLSRLAAFVRKGSIFEIYLPRVKGEASETDKFDMPLLTGTGRILFVDDEPALTMMGQRILGQLGIRFKRLTALLRLWRYSVQNHRNLIWSSLI